jgi:hypothetical protein
MRTALACLALLLALGLYGFLIVGWGAVIAEQGFEAAITDLTTQPSLPVTAACLVLGTASLGVGLSLLGRKTRG